MKPQYRFKSKYAVALLALAASPLATSQTLINFRWIGGLTPTWTDSNGWDYDADSDLPYPSKTGDSATISDDTVTLGNLGVTLEYLSLQSAGNLILEGNFLRQTRRFGIGDGGDASLTISDGTVSMISQTALDQVPKNGEGNYIGDYHEFIIGKNSGTGTVTQTGGTLNITATSINTHDAPLDPTQWTNDHPDTRIGAFGANGIYNLQGGAAEIYNLRIGFANGNSTGTVNHSGGTLTHHGELALGWAGAKGFYNLSGTGSLVMDQGQRIRVGATGGVGTEGTFNQTGGTVVLTNGRLELGTEGGGKGTYNMSGGTMTINADSIFVGAFDDPIAKGTKGVYNQTGGTVTTANVLVAFETGTSGTVFLGGGTLTTGSIYVRSDVENGVPRGGTGTLTFDGGTVIATNGGNFIYNFPNVTINSGGAIIDSNGNGIAIVPPVVGVGGLTKRGENGLSLTGVNNYDGDTIVEKGVLQFTHADVLESTSDVEISAAAGASIDLNYSGSNTVSRLIIDGTAVAAGTYGAEPTDANHIGVPYLTGTGTLIVTGGATPTGGFATWASNPANGLAEGQRGATFDADNDGFSNLLEYFLGGNPSQASTAIAPVVTRNGTDLAVSFNRSVDSGTDTTAVVQYSTDLVTWSAGTPVSGTGAINMTVPGANAANGKLFVRIKVSQLP